MTPVTPVTLVTRERMHDLPQPALPAPLRWLNRQAERRTARTGVAPRMEEADVLAAVEARFGQPVCFDERVHTALAVICRSVNEDSNLHFYGLSYVRNLVVTALVTRARLDQRFRDHPELDDTPLEPMTIVVGLQRSGTTFLHRLLAEAPDTRSLPLWEALDPVPPATGRDLRQLRMSLTFHAFRWAAPPTWDAIHFMRPSLPDECQFLMRLDLRSPVFWTPVAAFGYADFLFQEDMTETYRMYRRLLKLLQVSAPGRRLVLKNPVHALHLRELLDVMPDALVVQTHRDPLETLPSACKLALTAQSAMTRGVDPVRVVEKVTTMQALMAQRSVDVRESEAGRRIHDVDYRELLADPVGVVGAIHESAGLPFSAALEAGLDRYRKDNHQRRHGSNEYAIGQFGLDPAAVAERFRPYRERFGVGG